MLTTILRERSSKMDDRKPAAATTKRKKSTTKKRKASSSSSTGRTADLSAVLPWIPRAQLEALVTSSVNDHSAITTEQVINAMPDHEKWRIDPSDGKKKKSYTPVKSGPERVNTGAFDAVDSTTMLNIFMFLNCKEKYTCVMSVCKGWREFKATMPSLFLDLSDNSWTDRGRALKADKLLVLMDWVPNLAQVTALRISTQDKCNPATCKQIVKKLVAAKKKAKAPMITKLVLHGPKIYGSLIPELTKNEVGKNLTSLTFHDVKATQQTKLGGAIGDFFKSLPLLEELYMPQSLASELGNIHPKVLSPLKAARAGASTLLRVLDLGDRSSLFNKIGLEDLSTLGTSAPELEVLRLGSVQRPNARRAASLLLGDLSDLLMGDPAERILSSPMKSLPRLKEFSVGRLVDSYAYGGAPRCECLYVW
ncbi:hypothetical protein QTG54_010690 [Skeletonema marinoi]|uniref:F-box domain-containing protein n=1 Tax=Skeletonema marinoi TaxID=267567 RepID=A0AAD9DAH5_9STRA|nr:hypothetical protein QTG54_010690 [Skeletonema marinoi]